MLEVKRQKVTLTKLIKLRRLTLFRTTKHKMLRRTNFAHSLKGSGKKEDIQRTAEIPPRIPP